MAAVLKGTGRADNARDGDAVVITIGARGDRIVAIGADGIRSGLLIEMSGGSQSVWFHSGAEARTFGGETFAACETARRAALALPKVFIGRTLQEGRAVEVKDVVTRMSGPDVERVDCVATVVEAVRRAIRDLEVMRLAEALVEARSLR